MEGSKRDRKGEVGRFRKRLEWRSWKVQKEIGREKLEGSERDWKGEVGRFRKGLVRRRSNLKRKGASRGSSWFDDGREGNYVGKGGDDGRNGGIMECRGDSERELGINLSRIYCWYNVCNTFHPY